MKYGKTGLLFGACVLVLIVLFGVFIIFPSRSEAFDRLKLAREIKVSDEFSSVTISDFDWNQVDRNYILLNDSIFILKSYPICSKSKEDNILRLGSIDPPYAFKKEKGSSTFEVEKDGVLYSICLPIE